MMQRWSIRVGEVGCVDAAGEGVLDLCFVCRLMVVAIKLVFYTAPLIHKLWPYMEEIVLWPIVIMMVVLVKNVGQPLSVFQFLGTMKLPANSTNRAFVPNLAKSLFLPSRKMTPTLTKKTQSNILEGIRCIVTTE
jgi:hypothetical protein